MKHLLVTNDFPPKLGGIQSYLWELWRRLPPDEVTVLTTPHEGDEAWDASQDFRVVRTKERVLMPTPGLVRQVRSLADEVGAELVVLDPALPLGLIGPRLGLPYAVVLHGAEITVPGRTPLVRRALASVLRGAVEVIAAGGYPADEGERAARRGLPITVVPPGVDVDRFRPLTPDERLGARRRFEIPADADLVVGLSRLVPRKGFDVLIDAAAELAPTHPKLLVAIGGSGRDRDRLEARASKRGAPVRFLGRIDDGDMPRLFGTADVFAMVCRNRWGGLEQEGFGIVFLEAAAAGVPQIAGDSGGSAEAVVDGSTGLVVRRPESSDDVAGALRTLLADPEVRRQMGEAGRKRAEAEFAYDVLAGRLHRALSIPR